MEVREFEKLKQEIDDLKARKNKAEGAKEQILNSWKSYGFSTIEDAEERLNSLKEDIEKDEVKIEKIYDELKELMESIEV